MRLIPSSRTGYVRDLRPGFVVRLVATIARLPAILARYTAGVPSSQIRNAESHVAYSQS